MRILLSGLLLLAIGTRGASAQRQMEALGRGVVAIRQEGGRTFIGWRLLADDPPDLAFNVYRAAAAAPPVRLNDQPITGATHFIDHNADAQSALSYFVRALDSGREAAPSASFTLPASAPQRDYLSIPLQTLPGYTPGDASVGDLDGDGEYEIILKQEMRPRDNSQRGATGQTRLEAYKLDGTFLWRIDLGPNIREGAHYTQFMVYDLDGDGRAEIACKTADGTIDGIGTAIGDPSAHHRNADGFILEGPEFLTIFDGRSGRALASAPYIPARGDVRAWGDRIGNRADRFLACIAYLDGRRPSLVMCRGYYTRTVLAAWNWRDGRLSPIWTFDSDAGPERNRAFAGQGNHSVSVADVDADGRDEIIYGSCIIDDDGKGLYSTALGHGDALHAGDLDPGRPGLEVFGIHEHVRHPNGAALFDARTGALIWGKPSPDVVRGLALDIDPRHPGCEMWAAGEGLRGLWNARGEVISDRRPRSCNFGIWWDGDLLRELLDRNRIAKWNWQDSGETTLLTADGCRSNNGSKATPALCADIIGDWREELLLRSADNRELRLYTTSIPTAHRLYTLMHDPQYRLAIAWQNVGYNQPPHPGFFLGHGMSPPPRPDMVTPKK